MYQAGQAVIYWGNRIAFFHTKYDPHYGYTLKDFNGKLSYYHSIDRPATEAEILEQAVKHGWTAIRSWQYKSPFKWLLIVSLDDGWTIEPKYTPLSKDFAAYGQECITAHRLITALNLTK